MLEGYTLQYLHPLLTRPNFQCNLQAASLTYHMLEGYTLQDLATLCQVNSRSGKGVLTLGLAGKEGDSQIQYFFTNTSWAKAI
jgi:hypothetical protein